MDLNKIKDSVEQKYSRFNTEQKRAVEGILDRWDDSEDEFIFPIIDGPPGTGKTAVGTIATAKYILENPHAQITYLCFTHDAVEKAQSDLHLYGFPKDNAIKIRDNPERTDLAKGVYGCDSRFESVSFNDERQLKGCNVLLCTLHSARRALHYQKSSKIIIDEFSQVDVPMFFSTIRKIFSEKCNPEGYALLGDPLQLPVISSQQLLKPNIGVFIMQRRPHTNYELKIQHRMHEHICDAVNSLRRELHAYKIECGESVKDRDLTKLGYIWDKNNTPKEFLNILDPSNTLVIVNTDKCGEEQEAFGRSWKNPKEAELAAKLSMAMFNSFKKENGEKLKPSIISPYNAQLGEIKQKLKQEPDLQHNCISVYKSQGREYPCVIISFTHNNPSGYIGFLGVGDSGLREQTYVACSRAQAKLIVLMSFDTFLEKGQHPDFWALKNTKSAYIT